MAELYMARRVLNPIFGYPYKHLLSQLTLNFHKRKYYSWQNSRKSDRWWNNIIIDNTENVRRASSLYTTVLYISMHASSERWYDTRLFSCCLIVDSLEGQLVNSWVAKIAICWHVYLRVSFHCSSINHLCVHTALILSTYSLLRDGVHSFNQTCLDSSNSQWHQS